MTILKRLLYAAVVATLLGASPAPTAVTISTYGKGIGAWCLDAASNAHYFDAAGITIGDPITVYSDPNIVTSLTSGQANIAIGSVGAVLPVANGQTNQIVVIASSEGAPLTLVGPQNVTSISQLAGKTITLPSKSGSNTVITEAMLNATIGAGKWTALYAGGSSDARLAQVTTGRAAAAIMSDPFDLPADSGLHVLTRFGPQAVYWNGPVFSTRSWLAANHDTAVRFLTAFAKGCNFILDPKNKDAAIALLAKDTGFSVAASTEAYNYWVAGPGRDKGIPRNGMVDIPGFANTMKAMRAAGIITNQTFDFHTALDTSYLNEAVKQLR